MVKFKKQRVARLPTSRGRLLYQWMPPFYRDIKAYFGTDYERVQGQGKPSEGVSLPTPTQTTLHRPSQSSMDFLPNMLSFVISLLSVSALTFIQLSPPRLFRDVRLSVPRSVGCLVRHCVMHSPFVSSFGLKWHSWLMKCRATLRTKVLS